MIPLKFDLTVFFNNFFKMQESEKPPVYRDLWKEYLMVMEKAKKPPKFFNKFKWEDILTHLRLISHDMMLVIVYRF